MATKRIFYITADNLTVYLWNNGYIENGPTFNLDETGINDYASYVSTHTDVKTYCLADLIEEQYHHDTIPHVAGNDRKTVLLRKSRQMFRHTPYFSALVQGRESHGRRDDKVLYLGVTNPDTLSTWLTYADRYKVPVAGVYSVALLIQQLICRLNINSENSLVFTQQNISGYRQTFLNNHYLKVSRLALTKQVEQTAYNRFVIDEVFRNKKYLQRLRLLNNDQTINAYVFGHRKRLLELDKSFVDSAEINYHFIDEQDAARTLGLKSSIAHGQCEYLFIHLLAKSTPNSNYLPQADLRYYYLHNARNALKVASLMAVVMSFLWSAYNITQTYQINNNGAITANEIIDLQKEYDNATANLPATISEARVMQHAVETANSLIQHKTDPALALVAISQGLIKHPDIRIDEIEWQWSVDPNATIDATISTVNENEQQESSETSSQLYQIALIRARIDPFDGNFDYAFSEVNNFVADLRKNPDFQQVVALKMPLDINPKSSLAGVTGYLTNATMALFEIKIVLRTHHEPV